jgi:hypothetical protein
MEAARVKVTTTTRDIGWIAKKGGVMMVGGSEKKAQAEDLGDQVIEGVRGHGRREKRTTAVGEVGNDRPSKCLRKPGSPTTFRPSFSVNELIFA